MDLFFLFFFFPFLLSSWGMEKVMQLDLRPPIPDPSREKYLEVRALVLRLKVSLLLLLHFS